jgi:hypothetical protein
MALRLLCFVLFRIRPMYVAGSYNSILAQGAIGSSNLRLQNAMLKNCTKFYDYAPPSVIKSLIYDEIKNLKNKHNQSPSGAR